MVDSLCFYFRVGLLSLVSISTFSTQVALAEFHSGIGSGSNRTYADGPSYGYGGQVGGVGPCSPVSAANNVANPSFNTPVTAPQANPVAAPSNVASAARPSGGSSSSPAPTSTPAPSSSEESKPAASNSDDKTEAKSSKDKVKQSSDEKEGSSDLLAAGKKAFEDKCMSCHASNGHDPILGGVTAINTVGKDNGQMPPGGGLSDSEKESIIAYINSQKDIK